MKWPFAGVFKRQPEKPRIEPTLSLYSDPFAGPGPCRLAQAIPPDRRAAVTERCPRCGPRPDSIVEAGDSAGCVLQGLNLDLEAAAEDELGQQLSGLTLRAS